MEKHAYCFLTKGELNQPALWDSYFSNSSNDRFGVFLHPKMPVDVESRFKDNIIDSLIPTSWGGLDLVHATLNLFEKAYDWGADKFILLSDSCIPLYNYGYIYKKISQSNKNHIRHGGVDNETEHPFMHDITGRYMHAPKLIEITELKDFKKGSQWLVLNRETCRTFLDNDATSYFKGMFAPDEHYFQTMAQYHNLLDEEDTRNKSLTYVNWDNPHDWKHPVSYSKLTDKNISKMRSKGFLFARKITKDCEFAFKHAVDNFPLNPKSLEKEKEQKPKDTPLKKNQLIVSIVNDDFLTGAIVLLHSLFKNFRKLEKTQIKLYYNSKLKFAGLSPENRACILKLFPQVILQDVKCDVYKDWLATSDKIRSTYIKLHMFEETEYDKIIFLDTDTLVIRDFSCIFDWIQDEWVYGSGPAEESNEFKTIYNSNRSEFLNAGFMCIKKELTSKNFIKNLDEQYKFSEGQNLEMIDNGMHENKLIVEIFKGKIYAPDWQCNYRPSNPAEWRYWRILHWAGAMKPWSGALNSIAGKKFAYGGIESILKSNRIWDAYFKELLALCDEKNLPVEMLVNNDTSDIDFFFAEYNRSESLKRCVQMSKTNINRAEDMFLLLLSIHKDWPALHRELGYFYHLRKVDLKKALKHLKKACLLNKNSPKAFEMLGDLLVKLNNNSGALVAYKESYKMTQSKKIRRKITAL